MSEEKQYYVKTVFEPQHFREPETVGYPTLEEAESTVKMALQWGIGIVSCEVVEQ